MKYIILIAASILISSEISSQTKEHKLGVTAGAGSQKYRGDLGNGFTVKNNCWYGAASVNAGYFLNRSFDGGIFFAFGDFGFCQPDGKITEEVDFNDRCLGCIDRKGLGNLNSRMTTVGLMIKYKFSNGYILGENSKIKPYLYAGASQNYVADRMKMQCVNAGEYFSFNVGAGAKYYVTDRINLGYNLALGIFTSDHIDFKMNSTKDMYLQNSLFLGIDF